MKPESYAQVLVGSDINALVCAALLQRGTRYLLEFFGYALQSARTFLRLSFRSELIRACLAPWPTYAGLGPEAPASGHMARVIAYTLKIVGCPVVKGGSANIVRAFEQFILSCGGEFRAAADVVQILNKRWPGLWRCHSRRQYLSG